jgi:hypothetical protein
MRSGYRGRPFFWIGLDAILGAKEMQTIPQRIRNFSLVGLLCHAGDQAKRDLAELDGRKPVRG